MHVRLADYFFWLVAPLIQIFILVALRRRKLSLNYRYFLAYTLLQVVSFPILAAFMRWSYAGYYYAYYSNLVLSVSVSFAVIWEILARTSGWHREHPRLLAIVAICMAVTSITMSGLLLASQSDPRIFDDGMMFADRLLRIIQVVLMIVFIFLHTRIGVSPRSFLFGVGLGFGFFGACNMFVTAVASLHGLSSQALSRINSLSYLVSCIIWLVYAKLGTPDAKGTWRSSEPYLPPDSEHGPKEPPRWFFRTGLSHGDAAARV
jgi:hypothetical protein